MMTRILITTLLMGLISCQPNAVNPLTPNGDRYRLGSTNYVYDRRTNLCFLEFQTAYAGYGYYHGYTNVPCTSQVIIIADGMFR